MHRNPLTLPLILATGLLAGACDQPAPTSAPVEPPPPSLATAPTAAAEVPWLGRWTGPEGTYLDVLKAGPQLKVAIRNLDGVRTFDAVSVQGGLRFDRDGTTETIRPGTGADTGMKWLQDESDCLVVKAGEGYCRG